MTPHDTIRAYFDAFNAGDADGMLALVAEDVAHDVNQGEQRRGRDAFAEFLAGMDAAYRERAEDLVILSDGDGERMATEFTIHGTYLQTQEGLPQATGQTYRLPVGTFFALRDGRITRVTTYYNLAEWLRQVRG